MIVCDLDELDRNRRIDRSSDLPGAENRREKENQRRQKNYTYFIKAITRHAYNSFNPGLFTGGRGDPMWSPLDRRAATQGCPYDLIHTYSTIIHSDRE